MLVDPASVRTILENLVDNAFKYGGPDPAVRIETRREGRGVAVDVIDEGGTAPHGTGLGLSIARELARYAST